MSIGANRIFRVNHVRPKRGVDNVAVVEGRNFSEFSFPYRGYMIGVGASAGIGQHSGDGYYRRFNNCSIRTSAGFCRSTALGLRARCASRSWIHRRIGAFLDRLIIFVDPFLDYLAREEAREIQLCKALQRRAEGM